MAEQNIEQSYFLTSGVNTYASPLLGDGVLIHSVNFDTFPYGAKTKRTGYSSFLDNPDKNQVQSLFAFPNIGNDPSQLCLYRASGSSLYYYPNDATLTWHLAGNGTITSNAHFGHAILDNVLIGGDGITNSRYTTNGTSFTDGSLAPKAEFWEQYQNRVYALGTSSTLFYSTTNDATNWNTSGTSDSNSLEIPGAGKGGGLIKVADKLVACKSSGIMMKWDGYSLLDMATLYGPSSPYSIANVEGYTFFANQYGHYGFGGDMPQILSHVVERQFKNADNTGIAGSIPLTMPAFTYEHDYFLSIGTVTDDFTKRTIPDAILKYDFHKQEYLDYSFANAPTAFLSYKDLNGAQQFIFGDANGQVYQMDNSTTDNGVAIAAEMVYLFNFKIAHVEKQWRWWRGFFNPGCEAKIQVACSNVLDYQSLIWQEVGDARNGFVEYRFPAGCRSRFLFVRIYESSKNSRTVYYGCQISAMPNPVW